jgi:hypothetical protein
MACSAEVSHLLLKVGRQLSAIARLLALEPNLLQPRVEGQVRLHPLVEVVSYFAASNHEDLGEELSFALPGASPGCTFTSSDLDSYASDLAGGSQSGPG